MSRSQRIKYTTRGHLMPTADSAYVSEDEDPRTRLIESVVGTISTDVEVTAGGVTLHLAAWQDPDHWSEEWTEALGEDPDVEGFIAGLAAPDEESS
jgi:hypothetical protein